jgi:hypothetical protein
MGALQLQMLRLGDIIDAIGAFRGVKQVAVVSAERTVEPCRPLCIAEGAGVVIADIDAQTGAAVANELSNATAGTSRLTLAKHAMCKI